ncbi:MAG TPA: alpha/beta hydrolase-fold protein [Bryobacteraceae bacterium]|nr:alpha/beta hydrolase-fold protein [Bryobacteraceae bacterium]
MHTLTGNIRLHRNFHSRHLPDDRNIIVYLPPSYDEDTERRYPVFYLHDGQNMFDAETAFLGQEWHADEIAEDLIRGEAIEPLIMVGIYNAGERRIDEYTPTRGARTEAASGGKARLHAAMIVEEVKPFIDAEYRTLTTASCTALGGSSLGGLATLYAGLRNPHVFGKLAVLSPSVWWRNGVILRMIRDIPAQESRPKIWLDVGTAEGDDPGRCVDDTRRLRDALMKHGWALGKDLSYFEDSDAPHSEQAWTGRLPSVLRFLFGRITD